MGLRISATDNETPHHIHKKRRETPRKPTSVAHVVVAEALVVLEHVASIDQA